MSIRIPTMRSIALYCSWLKGTSMFVWWEMMRKVFILSVELILTIYCILRKCTLIRKSLSWNRTIALRKPLSVLPIAWLRKTKGRYARKFSLKRRRERLSVYSRHIVMWRRAILLSIRLRSYAVRSTMFTLILLYFIVPMHRAVYLRKLCERGGCLTVFMVACLSTSVKRLRMW